MAALSALAIVAQRSVLPAGQEAVQKAILEAELERTPLDYESSRMAAEDNRQKWNKGHQDSMAIMRYHVREARRDENYAQSKWKEAVEELEEKTEELEETIEELEAEMEQQIPFQLRCFIINKHTQPSDTEVIDRRKFMRLFKQ